LAARLLKQGEPQDLLMDEAFYREASGVFLGWRAAGNVGRADGGYAQFANVQGPWTKSLRGFKQPVHVFKWRGAAAEPQ
jgi:hypothetical protein